MSRKLIPKENPHSTVINKRIKKNIYENKVGIINPQF